MTGNEDYREKYMRLLENANSMLGELRRMNSKMFSDSMDFLVRLDKYRFVLDEALRNEAGCGRGEGTKD